MTPLEAVTTVDDEEDEDEDEGDDEDNGDVDEQVMEIGVIVDEDADIVLIGEFNIDSWLVTGFMVVVVVVEGWGGGGGGGKGELPVRGDKSNRYLAMLLISVELSESAFALPDDPEFEPFPESVGRQHPHIPGKSINQLVIKLFTNVTFRMFLNWYSLSFSFFFSFSFYTWQKGGVATLSYPIS